MAEASAVAGAAKSIGLALVTEAKYLYGIEDELRALQKDLVCMQQFLQDVDANPNVLKEDGQLRILTQDMRELAFRAEDVIDTYLVGVGFKIYKKNFFLKILSLASHWYPMHMLRNEIEAIQQEIKASMTRAESFRMSIGTTSQPLGACVGSSYSKPVPENYIHLDDEFVVGIGDDISRLVEHLTGPQDDFQVLGVVGTGGAGKTTLASQIYRHTKVQSSFPHRAFVSVSQKWSRLDLLQRISKEILGRSEISSSERELMTELHGFMKDKRCLVILDDIWKKEAWDEIYPFFPRTQNVKFILTTRIEEVPRHADTKCVLHEPQVLTNNQMWELFSKGAVEGRQGIENNIEFEKLGKLMLQKCHGLPLAVVTLVGILRTKQHLYEWEQVSVALKGKILKEKGGYTYGVVEEMLELSFLDLPAHLKPLFMYLAVIPEDNECSSEQLIQMWIGEGFVSDDQTGTCEALEDKAMQFLGELAQRCIIQVKKRNHRNEVERFSIHDLMREFCLKKASECQFLEYIPSTHSYGKRPRRLSIYSSEHCLEENNYLRTLVYSGLSWSDKGVIKKLESIHEDFKLLRVLRISNCASWTLPNKIGNLIHLTYLSIIDTYIWELPDSVRYLRNLTVLQFFVSPKFIFEKLKVPDDLVENMENLRLIVLPIYIDCKRLGLNSERHKKLHTLECGAGRWMMKDLPAMHLLTLRVLKISFIEKIEEMEAIHQFLGFFKGSLETFSCVVNDEELRFDTEKLMGMQSLHSLHLYGPLVNSVTIQFPPNLVSLSLSGSEIGEEVDLMGVLGNLSKLKHLCIGYEAYLGKQLRCMGGSFPQLEELTLSSYVGELIVIEGAMSRLNSITIWDCQYLKIVPQSMRTAVKVLVNEGPAPSEFRDFLHSAR